MILNCIEIGSKFKDIKIQINKYIINFFLLFLEFCYLSINLFYLNNIKFNIMINLLFFIYLKIIQNKNLFDKKS